MRKIAFAAATAAVIASSPAQAEGWTGAYVNVGVSGTASSADVTTDVGGSLTKVANINPDGTTAAISLVTGTPPTNLPFFDSNASETAQLWTLGTSPNATPVMQQVLTAVSEANGRANNRFRAGFVVEGGYDYELGSNFVVGLNGSYNFSGTTTSEGIAGIGNVLRTAQAGTLTAGTGATAPAVAAVKLGATATPQLYDLTNAGTFVAATGVSGAIIPLEAGGVLTQSTFSMGDSWSVGGRAGFAVSPSVLVFAAGGFTQAEVSVNANSTVVSTDTVAAIEEITEIGSLAPVSGTKWKNGYYLGGGVEAKLTGNVSLKAEYRFADYGSYSVASTEDLDIGAEAYGFVLPVDTTVTADNIRTHAVRLTLGYRF